MHKTFPWSANPNMSKTSNNERLGSAGEIDARCCRIYKSLTDVDCDLIRPRVPIYDLVCPRAQAGSSFVYTCAVKTVSGITNPRL